MPRFQTRERCGAGRICWGRGGPVHTARERAVRFSLRERVDRSGGCPGDPWPGSVPHERPSVCRDKGRRTVFCNAAPRCGFMMQECKRVCEPASRMTDPDDRRTLAPRHAPGYAPLWPAGQGRFAPFDQLSRRFHAGPEARKHMFCRRHAAQLHASPRAEFRVRSPDRGPSRGSNASMQAVRNRSLVLQHGLRQALAALTAA